MISKIYNEPVILYNINNENLEIYKLYYDNDWILEKFFDYNIIENEINNISLYKLFFITESIDCFYIIKWNDKIEFIRNGYPPPVLIVYFEYLESLDFIQYIETDIKTGSLKYLDNGIYIYEVEKLQDSLFIIPKLELLQYFKYNLYQQEITNIQLNNGLSLYGYNPIKNTYFDINTGQWKYKQDYITKVSDLAKAISYENNLLFEIRKFDLPENHIRNYIKYFRWYDNKNKRYLYYVPGLTPEDNINNFELFDENGIRGIEILTSKPITITTRGKIK